MGGKDAEGQDSGGHRRASHPPAGLPGVGPRSSTPVPSNVVCKTYSKKLRLSPCPDRSAGRFGRVGSSSDPILGKISAMDAAHSARETYASTSAEIKIRFAAELIAIQGENDFSLLGIPPLSGTVVTPGTCCRPDTVAVSVNECSRRERQLPLPPIPSLCRGSSIIHQADPRLQCSRHDVKPAPPHACPIDSFCRPDRIPRDALSNVGTGAAC